MDVIGEVVARDRRSERPALTVPPVGRSYSWHDLCTDSYRAGNVLRYLGVRAGVTVEVAPVTAPDVVLAFLGAAQLGAVTLFEAVGDGTGRVVLVPVDEESAFDLPPGSKLAVHGGSPALATTTHWEQELWSENPAVHPETVAPEDPVLTVGDEGTVGEAHPEGDADGRTEYSHADLLSAARRAIEALELTATDRVAVRGALRHPGVVAGLLAPLVAGGEAVVGATPSVVDHEVDATIAPDGSDGRSLTPDELIPTPANTSHDTGR